jgi:hypothetical protein
MKKQIIQCSYKGCKSRIELVGNIRIDLGDVIFDGEAIRGDIWKVYCKKHGGHFLFKPNPFYSGKNKK